MRNSNLFKFTYVGLVGLAASLSYGSFGFNVVGESIRSGFHDTSNLAGSYVGYDVELTTDSGDADLFLNGINIQPGSFFDSNLLFNIDPGSFVLGTSVVGGNGWLFDNVVNLSGAIDSNVPLGTYDFNVEFIGGETSTDAFLLGTVNFQIEVASMLEFTLTGSATPAVIPQGGMSTASATLFNDSQTRDLYTRTWYYGNGGFMMGSEALTGNFVGDWFDKQIAPGNSRTDNHTTWAASTGQAVGVYSGDYGLYGGLYADDEHSLAVPGVTIEVVESVPEPASMLALAGGIAALARRRISKKSKP